jgi:hypothetical protein
MSTASAAIEITSDPMRPVLDTTGRVGSGV